MDDIRQIITQKSKLETKKNNMGGGKKRKDAVDELNKLEESLDEKRQNLYTITERLSKKSKVYSLLSSNASDVVFKKRFVGMLSKRR